MKINQLTNSFMLFLHRTQVVKHSKGGATLFEHWHPQKADKETSLYKQLQKKVYRAMTVRAITVIGVLWMQGESDAINLQYAEAYLDNLRLLIAQWRCEWNNPNLFFVCGRINPPAERYPETPIVRKAQESLQVKGYKMIDMDDLPKVADSLHYNTEGILKMGTRFAKAMVELMKGRQPMLPMTVEEYDDASRASIRDTSSEPVEGWPHGAGILVEGNWQQSVLRRGTVLFNDATYQADEIPEWLEGNLFIRGSSKGLKLRVTEPGTLIIFTPTPDHRRALKWTQYLHDRGFSWIQKPEKIHLINSTITQDKSFWKSLQHRIYQKFIRPGEWIETGPWAVVAGFEFAGKEFTKEDIPDKNKGELLYNGVRLPEMWPSRSVDPYDLSCKKVLWLEFPPDIIPIDVGRQLFIDDFLIEQTSLKRVFHKPEKYSGNPVLKPETELEFNASGKSQTATAIPKSGGI
jgi:hypothetical protein